ncbi:MAG TPA: hypothetical protein VF762_21565 [Blastocatellia bacterium]|jgi:hypothetical protein
MKGVKQVETEETRRCLLVVLYEAGSALRAKTVRSIMDSLNSSTSWDDFLAQAEYLAGEELVRVFPADAESELTDVQQAKYIGTCKRMSFDSPEAGKIMMRIRQRGRRFMEGNDDSVVGVAEA